MENLPTEIIRLIFSNLAPVDIVTFQSLSKHCLRLGRDDEAWKMLCFEGSRVEAARVRERAREHAATQVSGLRELREAVSGFPNTNATSEHGLGLRLGAQHAGERQKARALISWDPTRPGEDIDFYQEYIHRHGPLRVDWMEGAEGFTRKHASETIGIGTLIDSSGRIEKLVAPSEDGSFSMWEMSQDASRIDRGRVWAQSPPGILDGHSVSSRSRRIVPLTNVSPALDSVSVDSIRKRAYFAMHDYLNEVDLETLQVIRRLQYPSPLSCLSAANFPTALTVGTSSTLHLYDTRDRTPDNNSTSGVHSELMNGPSPYSSRRAVLSEPGPLSILHSPLASSPDCIWVAGRFSSILGYDRRAWPRMTQTIFSGARLSSLTSLPHGYVPKSLDLTRNPAVTPNTLATAKAAEGATLIAAGQYKGKGSIELYGLTLDGSHVPDFGGMQSYYQNRQTASRSRLLSVAPHGGRLVFSDGDGQMKWVERDGTSYVRTLNVNEHLPKAKSTRRSPTPDSGYGSGTSSPGWTWNADADANAPSMLFTQTENSTGDIVQKIMPTRGNGPTTSKEYRTHNADDLLIWTADGRLGLVGFRGRSAFAYNDDGNGLADGSDEESAEEEKMRLFEARMRRALERQADEVRFVRGLGFDPYMS